MTCLLIGLDQIIDEPTHIQRDGIESCIDLILTNQPFALLTVESFRRRIPFFIYQHKNYKAYNHKGVTNKDSLYDSPTGISYSLIKPRQNITKRR